MMNLKPGDRVLDLGCGAGWASRLMAKAVANGDQPGQVVGLDVSDEMIRRARAGSADYDNVMFVVGSAQQIPWEENYLRQGAVGRVFLLLRRPGARAGRVVPRDGSEGRALHPDQPVPRQSLLAALGRRTEGPGAGALGAGVHRHAQARTPSKMCERCGCPTSLRLPRSTAASWFKNAEELRDFKRIGALLLIARKPDIRVASAGVSGVLSELVNPHIPKSGICGPLTGPVSVPTIRPNLELFALPVPYRIDKEISTS